MPSQALAPAGPTADVTDPRRSRVPLVTAAVVVGVAVLVLLVGRVPVVDVAKQVAYLVLGILVPGTIVHRSLRGPMQSWLADLALGAATGLVLELMAWAAFTSLHLQGLLWAWPLLTLLLLLRPATRQALRVRPAQSWGRLPVIALGGACTLIVALTYAGYMARYPLPPTGAFYYPDLLWHLGLVHEATRSVPLLTPQSTADGVLRYHWFSDAHMAATSLMTGTDPAVVVLRLWILPVLVLVVLLTAVLAQRMSGRPWVGALAAWLVIPPVSYTFWPGTVDALDHLSPLSPSQVFSSAMTLLLVITLADLVRATGRPRHGTIGLALLTALGTSGSKSSALPVVLGGVAVAFVAALALRRNRLLVLGIGAAGAVLTAAAYPFVAGGDAGSGVQLLSALSLFPLYRQVVASEPDLSTPVVPGLVHTPGIGPVLLVALLMVVLLTFVRLSSAVLPFLQEALRRDLAAWLMAGMCLTSFIPFLLIAHPGYSEFYFVYGAVPVGSALWAWGIGEIVGVSRSRARVAVASFAAMGVVSAVAAAVVPARHEVSGRGAQSAQVWTFTVEALLYLLVVLSLVVAAVLLRRRGKDWLPPVAAGVLVGPLLVTGLGGLGQLGDAAPSTSDTHLLSLSRTAAWIDRNVPLYDVMATNDHCLSGTGTGTDCDSREWWISGLGGRRVLLEGWAYLPSVAKKDYHDLALYSLNQAAFTEPDATSLGAIRARGVRWLVADSDAGTVSPDLPAVTDKVFESGTISVYRLR